MNCVYILRTLIEKYVGKKRGKLYVTSIDLQKAFDRVDREVVFEKMYKWGVSKKIINAVKNIYKEVRCSIKIKGGQFIGDITSEIGVKQGCKLSPILFLLVINDILEAVQEEMTPNLNNKEMKGLIFADDILIFSQTPIGMQRNINKISEYCKKWGLGINKDKTKVLICKRGNKLSKYEKWYLDNEKIEVVRKMEYLGMIVNGNLSWGEHIKRAKLKGIAALASLGIVEKRLPNVKFKIMRNIFNSMIKAKVLYGAEIWGVEKEKECLETIVNRCIKIIYGLPGTQPMGV